MMHDVDPATVSRALAGGARSVLVTPLSVEAIRQAVADVEDWVGRIASIPVGQAVAAPGRRTVIVGSKGGSGVTTIVSQLAYRLLPSRVTVVDLERLAPALADQLGVTLRQDLFELACGADDVDPTARRRRCHPLEWAARVRRYRTTAGRGPSHRHRRSILVRRPGRRHCGVCSTSSRSPQTMW